METAHVILITFGLILAGVTVFAATLFRGASAEEDNERWIRLTEQMKQRYPFAGYKAQLEFMRREKYQALKNTVNRNEDFRELLKEYELILDEQERIEEGLRQLGAEFDPYVANKTI